MQLIHDEIILRHPTSTLKQTYLILNVCSTLSIFRASLLGQSRTQNSLILFVLSTTLLFLFVLDSVKLSDAIFTRQLPSESHKYWTWRARVPTPNVLHSHIECEFSTNYSSSEMSVKIVFDSLFTILLILSSAVHFRGRFTYF